jgi:polyisoprenoid-binding protein YceI
VKTLTTVAILAVLVILGTAGTLGFAALRPPATASGPIQAAALTPASTDATAEIAASSAAVYAITPAASQARFVIDEVLNGAPKSVVGTTDQVAGQIALDPNDTSSAQVGTILVDARTLTTDDAQRTRALQNLILQTTQYEYISFAPTGLSGLPVALQAGQRYPAQIVGDLTIKGITRPVTFDVTVTPAADGQLTGIASTTIPFADWGVSIPSVPFVASVDQQVRLELDFTANAA